MYVSNDRVVELIINGFVDFENGRSSYCVRSAGVYFVKMICEPAIKYK